MTHATRFVAVAVLVALAATACAPQEQEEVSESAYEGLERIANSELDALLVRAEAGDAEAQNILGSSYSSGFGVPEDDAEAARWYRLAADQGHAGAQNDLGLMYANGQGVPEDHAEAVRWYRLAAEQGHASAQGRLGNGYANGQGVPQDDVQAHLWFDLAASRMTGVLRESAVEARDLAASRLTPDDLSEAQRLAREWDAAHPREP